ncbi:Thiol-disulfide isomerase or thioredoxin [Pedobacter sp. ok626]|nr:Thiol-disulfide isomerase or thioredoxin [Pedobacter sp. ok626]
MIVTVLSTLNCYHMRKISLMFLCFILMGTFNLKSQEKTAGYTIYGDVTAIPDAEMVYLTASNLSDSAKVKDGKFAFKGFIGTPERAALRLKHRGQGRITTIIHEDNLKLFLSNGKVFVKSADKFNTSTINAGKLHDEYITYYAGLFKIYNAMQPVNTRYYAYARENNTKLMQETKVKLDSLRAIEFAYATDFIRKKPKSPIALYAVQELAKPIANPPDFPSAFLLLDTSLQQTPLGRSLQKMIDVKNSYVKGHLIPDFAQPDLSGKLVKVGDFRGKYLFIDFWASWCGPCRLENPNLKRSFEKYKNDGFVVLAVSIDESKEKWINAINQDGTDNFIHVGDMKGRANSAAQLLKVSSIPQNFLIDPSGKILGKNLHGLDLDNALEKIFNNLR